MTLTNIGREKLNKVSSVFPYSSAVLRLVFQLLNMGDMALDGQVVNPQRSQKSLTTCT